jgi:hypothetical protein
MTGILPGTKSVFQILRNGKRLGIGGNYNWKVKNEEYIELTQLGKSNSGLLIIRLHCRSNKYFMITCIEQLILPEIG